MYALSDPRVGQCKETLRGGAYKAEAEAEQASAGFCWTPSAAPSFSYPAVLNLLSPISPPPGDAFSNHFLVVLLISSPSPPTFPPPLPLT